MKFGNLKIKKKIFSADNTYPNLIPLLTGLNVSEFEVKCIPDDFYDECYMIWKDFVKKGIRFG